MCLKFTIWKLIFGCQPTSDCIIVTNPPGIFRMCLWRHGHCLTGCADNLFAIMAGGLAQSSVKATSKILIELKPRDWILSPILKLHHNIDWKHHKTWIIVLTFVIRARRLELNRQVHWQNVDRLAKLDWTSVINGRRCCQEQLCDRLMYYGEYRYRRMALQRFSTLSW